MTTLASLPPELQVVARKLEQWRRLLVHRQGFERRAHADAPTVEAGDLASVTRMLGRTPPQELLVFAALELHVGRELGFGGVRYLLHAPQQEFPSLADEHEWQVVAEFSAFWMIEMEIDGSSDLPEVRALGLAGPEDLESPQWIVELATDADLYRLTGPKKRRYDDPILLAQGSLADILSWAIDAQLERLPTVREQLEAIDVSDFELPLVTITSPDPDSDRWVEHPKFGRGRVREASGSEAEQKLTIAFETAGTKTLLARFVRDVS